MSAAAGDSAIRRHGENEEGFSVLEGLDGTKPKLAGWKTPRDVRTRSVNVVAM